MSLCGGCRWQGYVEDDQGNKNAWCKKRVNITTDFSNNIIKCSEYYKVDQT